MCLKRPKYARLDLQDYGVRLRQPVYEDSFPSTILLCPPGATCPGPYKTPGLKVCVHHRKFRPVELLTFQIIGTPDYTRASSMSQALVTG